MRHRFLLVALFATLSTPTLAATEDPHAFPKLCAQLDLEVITDIESAGQAQQISGETLAAAFFTVMKARKACAEGRHNEAIAIYESIAFE